MGELEALLETVARWARRCGLSEEDTARAQADAWYCWSRRKGEQPDGVWARWSVRRVRSGRDLPGCGTRAGDALHRMVQGAGMNGVRDRTPPPDKLASHREELEILLADLTPAEREVIELTWEGLQGDEIAARLHKSPARISQVRRSVWERWEG